ncbi:MAG: hypothetical protein J5997_02400 [Oscillospiraceae bacterium]|nr:hypothetical protein [Oscillospiraceae bacterium]
MAFFEKNTDAFPEAQKCIELLTGNTAEDPRINIKILKGGSYKIKNYYLENYKLADIRGASVLLTHVEEDIIPKMISDRFIPECIVYSGGGNIFAVVPDDCNDSFALELEGAAKKLLISADIAYYISKSMMLSDILGENYKAKMVDVENRLNERKKLIINSSCNAHSEYFKKKIGIVSDKPEDCFEAEVNGTIVSESVVCEACGKRNAVYKVGGDDLCTSCLHKRAVGNAAKRSRYINRFNLYNTVPAEPVKSLGDISREYIAVIYGDGNNMGGIIQQFTKITQMMEFSRDVKSIVDKAVFESMNEHQMTRFEVVGLGGDDVFIIVEGDKAIRFTVSMIKKYNSKFEKYRASGQVSTMSAGIAIAKTDMPIRVVIDKAEEKLSEAKSIAKLKKDNCGSISFDIMDTFDGDGSELLDTSYGAAVSMLPYYTNTAEDIIRMTEIFAKNKNKTRLRNVLDAFLNAESAEEAELFLKYFNAKNTGAPVELLPVEGYTAKDGFYVAPDGRRYIIWKDLITLMEFIK